MSEPPSLPPSPQGDATLTVDTSRWPLVLLTFSGKPTDQQVADHLKEIEERVLGRRERFVQIVDQRRGEPPDAVQRALIAEHQKEMEHVYRRCCLGEAYVVSPETQRAMVAVFWMAKPLYPYTFLESLGEAIEWAQQKLKEAGSGEVDKASS